MMRSLAAKLAPLTAALLLGGCGAPPLPADNGALGDGPAIAARPVMIGTEGQSLAACASTTRIRDAGTDAYWSPDDLRVVKARLAGSTRVAVCEAAVGDTWFGVVFAPPGGDLGDCQVGKPVRDAREYQGPCRSGWIRGGNVVVN